ncbi:MAG: type II CAAX prenyl endopeptidase Rce1 family protein [Betaproteobacteria bacterium]
MTARQAIVARLYDVREAILTLPARDSWRRCAWVYLAFAACAAPAAWASGLAYPARAALTPGGAAILAGTLALHPAFSEEVIFRALLLPRRPDRVPRGRLCLVAAIALLLYVAAHPINAILFRPAALPVFSAPPYLAVAALLGAACTAAYLISGSIWPAVLLHWTTVVLWMLLFGGWALVGSGR